MDSIVFVSLNCILFIHLGLGDTINRILRSDFILLRCTKCLNFWAVLSYAVFFTDYTMLESLVMAFGFAYIALWVDLALSKLACKYEDWYPKENDFVADAETEKDSRADSRKREEEKG